jgi:hypothetical protein
LLSSHQEDVAADEISSQYSVPAFNIGFNEDCTLTSEGPTGADTVNVSSAVSGIPEGLVPRIATVRSPGVPSNCDAKSAPVKIPSDPGVKAAATSRLMGPKGVVLLPTTHPDVVPKLSPGPRFEKITPALAEAVIPAIRTPIAPFIGSSFELDLYRENYGYLPAF